MDHGNALAVGQALPEEGAGLECGSPDTGRTARVTGVGQGVE